MCVYVTVLQRARCLLELLPACQTGLAEPGSSSLHPQKLQRSLYITALTVQVRVHLPPTGLL
jgi:hypothetical protein